MRHRLRPSTCGCVLVIDDNDNLDWTRARLLAQHTFGGDTKPSRTTFCSAHAGVAAKDLVAVVMAEQHSVNYAVGVVCERLHVEEHTIIVNFSPDRRSVELRCRVPSSAAASWVAQEEIEALGLPLSVAFYGG